MTACVCWVALNDGGSAEVVRYNRFDHLNNGAVVDLPHPMHPPMDGQNQDRLANAADALEVWNLENNPFV